MINSIEIQNGLFQSICDDLEHIIRSSRMELSPSIVHGIGELLKDLFGLNADGALRKVPDDLVEKHMDRGIFNVIPAKKTSNHITDTLFVYCKGSDNLLNRLADMLIAVGKYNFRNVFFVTSKWDSAVVTGNNKQRLQDIFELRQSGVSFCFILVSTSGISTIHLI